MLGKDSVQSKDSLHSVTDSTAVGSDSTAMVSPVASTIVSAAVEPKSAVEPMSGPAAGRFEHPYLTKVESVDTGLSVVPPPTVTDQKPECRHWAGDAYAQAVVKEAEVPFVEERIVYKKVKKILERPVEVVRTVRKEVVKEVVEFKKVVTDEVVEVPKPYTVEVRNFVPNYLDSEQYCAVAQKYKPRVSFDPEPTAMINCTVVEPEMHVVDVVVPKLVSGYIVTNRGDTRLKRVDSLSKAQWNSLVLKLNPELCKIGQLEHLPVHRDEQGNVIAFKPEQAVGIPL
ncbi:hypothetical protein GNI_001280 [Gregarina niphandrodes]|uniref:Inner membrane complex protein n=1 Tax=Gregarina niphandrodes TaxID=110365 RepID=A0A023BDN3_GRENI|nr:hypothetical protein GNI_001280 [Gregarina niphandrodes]EZG89692.1 hypothetical protein GNI_001280 [Gregarina niphandrodes]|eukprot:XP_011128466.1 hypothetical protein GNI_001280 [Gregarina niphandrodes]